MTTPMSTLYPVYLLIYFTFFEVYFLFKKETIMHLSLNVWKEYLIILTRILISLTFPRFKDFDHGNMCLTRRRLLLCMQLGHQLISSEQASAYQLPVTIPIILFQPFQLLVWDSLYIHTLVFKFFIYGNKYS